MKALFQMISSFLGYILIGWVLYYTGSSNKKDFEVLFNIYHEDSLIFIALILLGITLIAFGFKGIWVFVRSFFFFSDGLKKKNMFFKKNGRRLAELYYRNELNSNIGLQKKLPKLWMQIIDNVEKRVAVNDIMNIIEYEGKRELEIIQISEKFFKIMASVSSSVGVLGTIIGLIKLFKNMTDYSTIGDNMSLAFITTLYGVLFSVVIFSPIGMKMQRYKDDLVISYRDAYFWLDVIGNKKPISYLDDKKNAR